jgi:glycosyltransferase involved in cell wall biosynthesis
MGMRETTPHRPSTPARPSAPGGRGPTLTVAICTRERPELLRRALASLARQDEPPAEILVVDNAPASDSTRDLVAGEYPEVRYLREPVPGLDFARNAALRSASGDVVAFLDDDAVVERGWARAKVAAFRANPRLGVCTGRVEPLRLETEGQRVFEANGGFSRGSERIRLPADARRPLHGRAAPLIAWAVSVGSGCSFAVKRDLAVGLGGFDEALDMGRSLPGGGDHDMLWRVLQAGFDVQYEPAAVARHEHRRELSAAYDQIVGHQRALVAMITKAMMQARGKERLAAAAFLGWRLSKPAARLVRRALGRDPLPVPVLLRMWWHCWLGLVAYPLARRRAARLREAHGQDHRLGVTSTPPSL